MQLLGMDPGIRGSGCSFFVDGLLVKASYVRNPSKRGNGPAECLTMAQAVAAWVKPLSGDTPIDQLIVEWPRVYTVGKQRSESGSWRDPNDLLALTGVDCAVAAILPGLKNVERYFPDAWKGQVSKVAMNNRVLGRLSDEERSRIEDAGALSHNIYDGIGLSLKWLSRLEPVRIFPGATPG